MNLEASDIPFPPHVSPSEEEPMERQMSTEWPLKAFRINMYYID